MDADPRAEHGTVTRLLSGWSAGEPGAAEELFGVVYRQLRGGAANLLRRMLDRLVEQLRRLDPRQGEVVELRIFAGLQHDEIAAALELSTPTVKRDWRMSRAWLARELRIAEAAPP